jgi:hypothetical protein
VRRGRKARGLGIETAQPPKEWIKLKKLLGAVAAITTAFVLLGSPAGAQSVVDVQRDGDITWVHGAVATGDFSNVQIKLLSNDGGENRVWQKCNYSYTGAGTYVCGIDSGAGSLAQDQSSKWVAKVSVDGSQIGRQSFTL